MAQQKIFRLLQIALDQAAISIEELHDFGRGAQVSILSATAWDRQEQAYWNEPEKHGAFTWFLLEAMHKADGAGDGDGVVTIGEMHDYVTEGVLLYTVERSEGTTQTPSLSAPDRKHALIRMKR